MTRLRVLFAVCVLLTVVGVTSFIPFSPDPVVAAAEKTKQQQEEVAEAKEEKTSAKKEEGFFDSPMVKSVGRTAANIITRSLLGALGLGGRSTSRRRKSLF